ncbi:MAG: hypothetical protein D6803_08510 [Anaerolineae bacterium]|nr:MAG: hypothetical protein D6803_08510 [Anaerolineae bacterium]
MSTQPLRQLSSGETPKRMKGTLSVWPMGLYAASKPCKVRPRRGGNEKLDVPILADLPPLDLHPDLQAAACIQGVDVQSQQNVLVTPDPLGAGIGLGLRHPAAGFQPIPVKGENLALVPGGRKSQVNPLDHGHYFGVIRQRESLPEGGFIEGRRHGRGGLRRGRRGDGHVGEAARLRLQRVEGRRG